MSYLRDVADAIRMEVPLQLVPSQPDNLFMIYAALAHAKGEQTTAEDVHDAWRAWMEMRGEQYDSMVPFHQLAESSQAEHVPFVEAIHAVAIRIAGR